MNKIKGLGFVQGERGQTGTGQALDFVGQSPNDKIPAHVWAMLQQGGEQAVTRLVELLSSSKFNKLRGSEQANLIRLALEYAYGKPDAPLKRSVSVSLSGDASDAVTEALERMRAIDVSPTGPDTPSEATGGPPDSHEASR